MLLMDYCNFKSSGQLLLRQNHNYYNNDYGHLFAIKVDIKSQKYL